MTNITLHYPNNIFSKRVQNLYGCEEWSLCDTLYNNNRVVYLRFKVMRICLSNTLASQFSCLIDMKWMHCGGWNIFAGTEII